MFTLKHVTPDGNEELHYGSSPIYSRTQSGGDTVHYTDSKSEVQTIRWGKVYVMNEHGKTVATYDMGDRPGVLTGEAAYHYISRQAEATR